jgi:ABC-2 type transport system permease protein
VSTFTPAPGAAPLTTMVLAQTRMETKLLLRNGEQLLLALVIPLIVLVGGVEAAQHLDHDFADTPVNTLTPGVLALAIMSTSFASLAIATGFERRYGVLKRLGASPLPRVGLLAGKVGALLLVEVCQAVVICVAAKLMDWDPTLTVIGLLGVVATVLVGTAAFAALGLLAEATLAVANLVYLLLLAGGAVVLPATSYGGFGDVAKVLPSGALGSAMREAVLDGSFPVLPLAVLLGWAAGASALAVRTFRWE